MRKGETLTKASGKVRISPKTVKKYVGTVLVKTRTRFVPQKTDRLLRRMRIYENGKTEFVQVRGNKTAHDIARYHSSIGILMNSKNQQNTMEQFTNLRVVDHKGRVHRLETRKKILEEILKRSEEHETFDPYVSS